VKKEDSLMVTLSALMLFCGLAKAENGSANQLGNSMVRHC
tara:strand:- start:1571 stop:1690 length:120 start_codon:yes stop_codon:yes gene_type:complete